MSSPLDTVAEIAAEGKNIVITTLPAIGSVSKTLANLEAAGLSIAILDTATVGLPDLGIFVADGDNLRMLLSEEILNAEVLFFDGIESASPEVLEAITEVMTDRTLNGVRLPSVKSVVATSIGYDAKITKGLDTLENTVTINVR
jgi:hypothetical protein